MSFSCASSLTRVLLIALAVSPVDSTSPSFLQRSTHDCPENVCQIVCPGGFKADEKGCEVCECNEVPSSALQVELFDEEEDEEEEKEAECPENVCQIVCPGGFKADEKGCELCECNEVPSSALQVELFDKEEDEDEEKEAECPENVCQIVCPGGFKADEKGCELCECNEVPSSALQVRSTLHEAQEEASKATLVADFRDSTELFDKEEDEDEEEEAECPENVCQIVCPGGFKADEHGCELCECNEVPSSALQVGEASGARICPNGTEVDCGPPGEDCC